jgi:endonuclease/exonuclease/phosphatase family metal-dependent hydrolase
LDLRVVSWNVRYFGHGTRGLSATRGGIRAAAAALAGLDPRPQLVALQEVEQRSLRSRLSHDRGHDQLAGFMDELERAFGLLGRPLPFRAVYFPAHQNRVRGLTLQSMGLAVLVDASQLQIDAHNAARPHAITHFHLESFRARKQNRIVAHLELRLPDRRALHLFNTHLSLPTPFARDFWIGREKLGFGNNQLEEARTLARFVRERSDGDPFLVAGDFNSPPGSPVYRFLTEEAGFTGAQEALGLVDPARPRGFPTAGFLRLRMHLDHLFVGGGLRPLDLAGTAPYGDRSSPFAGKSDHVPLIARLALP